jgi:hypothetical protein
MKLKEYFKAFWNGMATVYDHTYNQLPDSLEWKERYLIHQKEKEIRKTKAKLSKLKWELEELQKGD